MGASLNHLRYTAYMNMVATRLDSLRPERLPPTENAARYHIFRVHLQAVQWMSLMSSDIKPERWGWQIVDGHYVPLDTDLDVVPAELLDFVKCKCRMDSRRPCSSHLCTCVKHGLPCLAACKHCNGQACENASE